jgi:hypothetical protein
LIKVAQYYTTIKIEAFSRALRILAYPSNILLLHETHKTIVPFNVAIFSNFKNLGYFSDLIKSCGMLYNYKNLSLLNNLKPSGLSINNYSL